MNKLASIIFTCLLTSVVCADPVTVPNTFSAGTPAKASEVNANFTALANAVNNISKRAGFTLADANGVEIFPFVYPYNVVKSVGGCCGVVTFDNAYVGLLEDSFGNALPVVFQDFWQSTGQAQSVIGFIQRDPFTSVKTNFSGYAPSWPTTGVLYSDAGCASIGQPYVDTHYPTDVIPSMPIILSGWTENKFIYFSDKKFHVVSGIGNPWSLAYINGRYRKDADGTCNYINPDYSANNTRGGISNLFPFVISESIPADYAQPFRLKLTK